MKIHLIAVGTKMPSWINSGYEEYAKRLPSNCQLILHEVPSQFRGKNPDIPRLLREEGQKMLKLVPKGAEVVALEPKGKSLSTESLAVQLERWMGGGRDVALLVGGPEGLSPECLEAAQRRWSLSLLTFPHPLVRVIVAEGIYRAWSVMTNHPYHRA